MDNCEWLDNYRPEGKFGLFSIDHNNGNRNGQYHKQLDLSRQKTKGAVMILLCAAKITAIITTITITTTIIGRVVFLVIHTFYNE